MAQAKFKFVSEVAADDSFTVVSFTGSERVSELYRYDIQVKAPLSAGIDLDDVLNSAVCFSIIEENGETYPVNGILKSFEEFKTVQDYAHFKAVLVPKIWKLSNYKTHEIFYEAGVEGELDAGQTIAEIIAQVLDKAGMLETTDYNLNGIIGDDKLLKREYICQYNESDFDFISRLMENEGVFYYFEQSSSGEVIVFLNDQNYEDLLDSKLTFDIAAQGNCVFGWSCRKQRLPQSVVVRDYNVDMPSSDVSRATTIDNKGQGTEYIYGKNVKTELEATYLSQIRAEGHICRQTEFFGESSVARLQAGHCFELKEHPNDSYNSIEYLVIEVNHEGYGLDMSLSSIDPEANGAQYQNSFVAILATTQYRPPLKTKKPRITGTLHARIDGELDSEYAQLDNEGRYKVSLPFDFHSENHLDGLASARVRMMQPYAGKNRGMQFPMAKGTEVLLSFVDGDPDRPIIAGAINTAAAQGPVTANNQTESVIQTGSANKIRMEDKFGFERVILESPAANSWIRVGVTNDPITLNGTSPHYVDISSSASYIDPGATITNPASTNIAVSNEITRVSNKEKVNIIDLSVAGEYMIKYSHGDDVATRRVVVCNPDEVFAFTSNAPEGIRLHSAGALWLEAKSRYGEYYTGKPSLGNDNPSVQNPPEQAQLLAKFGTTYKPTNFFHHSSHVENTAAVVMDDLMATAHVKVSSLDTFTTQEGNIYDFGGYSEYNLGKRYVENHTDLEAKLNRESTYDILDGGGTDSIEWTNKADLKVHEKIGVPGTDLLFVQKNYGNAYEYNQGARISVAVGDLHELNVGGTHIKDRYTKDGKLYYRSERGTGVDPDRWRRTWWAPGGNESSKTSETEFYYLADNTGFGYRERKWDFNTGALYTDMHTNYSGMGAAKLHFNYANTAELVIDSGSLLSSNTYLGGRVVNNNYIGGNLEFNTFIGGKAVFNMALAPMVQFDNSDFTIKFPGLGIETNTNIVDTKITDIVNSISTIKSTVNKITTTATRLGNIATNVNFSAITMLN
jgi:type VI secretion system VgrG family protein